MAFKGTETSFDDLLQGIERIRRMSQRIAEAHDMVTANNRLLRRDRELIRSGPLHDARDLRTHESQSVIDAPREARRARARRR